MAGAGAVAAFAGAGLSARQVDASSRSSKTFGGELMVQQATPTAGALTIVLVHGAWDNSSGWNGVIPILEAAGYNVVTIANPLRGVSADGNYAASVAAAIPGPVLLVGHSYGGAVITQAGTNVPNAVGLVYVAAFAPDEGETGLSILQGYPPTELGAILRPTPVMDPGATEPHDEFTLDRARFHDVFCADVPAETATLMAVTQRPVSSIAFGEPFGVPAWKSLPSWAVIATADLALGVEALRGMATRAGATTTDVDASHVVMISQPQAVADVILTAAAAVG
ncbi:MAG: alpha/beta hydrolase [Thermomicrobiales bacterium]|nr:alpha/beta hydrolase [Thermomicrobiales bacterium]